jgi:hypothetical protein
MSLIQEESIYNLIVLDKPIIRKPQLYHSHFPAVIDPTASTFNNKTTDLPGVIISFYFTARSSIISLANSTVLLQRIIIKMNMHLSANPNVAIHKIILISQSVQEPARTTQEDLRPHGQ